MSRRFSVALHSLVLPNDRIAPIAMAAAGIWLITFFPEAWGGATSWIIRATCIALWGWLASVLLGLSGQRLAILAPLFLITTLALWLYAIIPAGCVAVLSMVQSRVIEAAISSFTAPELFRTFIDSEGELAVLRFSLAGIAASAWMVPLIARKNGDERDADILPPRWITLFLGILFSVTYVLLRHAPLAASTGHIYTALLQMASFVTLLIYFSAIGFALLRIMKRAEGALIDMAILAVLAVGPVLFDGLKPIIFIFGIVGVAVALIYRSTLLFVGALVIVLIVLISGIMVRQAPGATALRVPDVTGHLASKIIFRQVETVDCLTGVLRSSPAERSNSPNPFYFAEGLLPRILWPEKVDLSKSGKIVIQYCHPIFAPNLYTRHSASGTLLWEPAAFAGVAGQIVSQLLSLVLLIGLSRLWIDGGPYAAAGVFALMPWAIDFDQHFALYIAILTKGGLVIGICLFSLAWVGRILRWR